MSAPLWYRYEFYTLTFQEDAPNHACLLLQNECIEPHRNKMLFGRDSFAYLQRKAHA